MRARESEARTVTTTMDFKPDIDEPTAIESTGQELPEPPAYEVPYEPGDTGYESAQKSGHYGILFAGEYAWCNVRCTAEAYGESGYDGHKGGWTNTVNGKPRRSLNFHTTWMDVDETIDCVREIGDYNRFSDERVIDVLEACPENTRFVVGRESSPVLYLWTDKPAAVMDILTIALPDELDAFPAKDTYPTLFMGKSIHELEDSQETALIRAWWD